jgi:hypothetical protein
MQSDIEPYVQAQYSREDYKLLGKTGTGFLRTRLRQANYRDKKIQRMLTAEESKVFHGTLDDVPLYLNHVDPEVVAIAQWRLTIAK